eukprot:TRINITY_DN143_c0_g3_i1.p1 TRINITY_DN143_c0_g3~~TRINITY_DN143_c0_g3_i1.p1  ORF type:complete len:491 (-),score=126.91 TRINITY_DN143_c0_g3_i1:938-2389(-)
MVMMKAVLCAAMLAAAVVVAQPPTNPAPQEFSMSQVFDHFDKSDGRTFTERYLVYAEYYQPGGPMFFTAGGESDVHGGYAHNGFQFELAQQVGAFILYAEHRFYGDTLPFGAEDSYTRDNIQKLTIEQAMADFVSVIAHVKAQFSLPDDIPVIAWGGSYAGELVTYMRVAYPAVIHASVAGSAPVNYHTGGDVDNGRYFAVTTDDFGSTNPECPDLVRSAFNELNTKARANAAGRSWVTSELMLCSPLAQGEDALRMVALWVENAYAQLAMLDYPWPYNGLPAFPIDESCALMTRDPNESLTHRLGQSIGLLYNSTLDLKCFNISEEYYPCSDITGCGGGVGDPNAMSWDYQSCTQLIGNVDTNNITDMFPPSPYDLDSLTEYCDSTWGATPDPLHLSKTYPYANATRIIFSNGYLDPWWPGGVLDANKKFEQYTILIDEAAHHLDFYGSDPLHDPQAVVDARQQEAEIIKGWIAEIAQELKQ